VKKTEEAMIEDSSSKTEKGQRVSVQKGPFLQGEGSGEESSGSRSQRARMSRERYTGKEGVPKVSAGNIEEGGGERRKTAETNSETLSNPNVFALETSRLEKKRVWRGGGGDGKPLGSPCNQTGGDTRSREKTSSKKKERFNGDVEKHKTKTKTEEREGVEDILIKNSKKKRNKYVGRQAGARKTALFRNPERGGRRNPKKKKKNQKKGGGGGGFFFFFEAYRRNSGGEGPKKEMRFGDTRTGAGPGLKKGPVYRPVKIRGLIRDQKKTKKERGKEKQRWGTKKKQGPEIS